MGFPDLFELTDYRRYLRAWFRAAERARERKLIKTFADQAGCSGSHVANILAGRKNLTTDLLSGFCRALGLSGPEAEHFGHMVRLCHPLSELDGKAAAEALEHSRIQNRRQRARLNDPERPQPDAELVAWAHPLISALAACPGFRNDPLWIAAAFSPALGLVQAVALGTLLPPSMLSRLWLDPRSAVTVATPDTEEGRVHIEGALSRARVTWERVPEEHREMRISVWGMPRSLLPELLALVDEFLPEATAEFTTAAGHRRRQTAMQMLVEVFPLTPPVREVK